VEEDLFPHKRSAEDPVRLEEERRLCYVGITRAKERLYITHAETRRLYGSETYPRASRFVHEIPNELIHEVRLRGSVSQPMFAKNQDSEEPDSVGFRLGQRVFHAKFGEGIVLNFEGQGSHARVQVNFDEAGSKWLVVAYANLQVAESHF
jgi:DNA helicase-2/ATP-dependent DNA helicase PcrA